jgi:hypothetical protein
MEGASSNTSPTKSTSGGEKSHYYHYTVFKTNILGKGRLHLSPSKYIDPHNFLDS